MSGTPENIIFLSAEDDQNTRYFSELQIKVTSCIFFHLVICDDKRH